MNKYLVTLLALLCLPLSSMAYSLGWRNTQNGDVYLYTLTDAQISSVRFHQRIPLDWKVIGQGDFNGDQQQDIIWYHPATGKVYWHLIDGQSTQTRFVAIVGQDWILATVADFDGDGDDDLLWRHQQNGKNYLYASDVTANTTHATRYINSVPDMEWRIVGAGDFDGDTNADILWHHQTLGLTYIYFMNGAQVTSAKPFMSVPPIWQVAAVKDFDGDSKADIFWRNSDSGENYLSLMNGHQAQSHRRFNQVNTDWTLTALDDLNQDGTAELLWRNAQTGHNYLYLVNGHQFSVHFINQVDPSQWRLLGANAKPVAQIDSPVPAQVEIGTTVTFSASSSSDDGSIVEYLWNDQTTGVDYQHTFNTPGLVTITLQVRDDFGLVDSTSVDITVTETPTIPPVARISPMPTEVELGSSHTFSGATSSDEDGTIVSYLWHTGETTESISITFDQAGSQTLSLTVTDDDGESDTVDHTLTVVTPPSGFTVWVEATAAPTIWAWTANTSISEEMGFTWEDQETLVADPAHPGFFKWELPQSLLGEVTADTPLKFKLNSVGYPYTINRGGCLSTDNQWDNASDGCFKQEDYRPYIGPYLTLISPDLSDNNETVEVLNPSTNMVVNYETSDEHSNWTAKVQYRALGDSTWQEQQETITGRKIHHITLSQLAANTTYEYRVVAPDARAGRIYRFTTAATDLTASEFLAIGDMQDPGNEQQRWQDVANAILANHVDDFGFIITVGDMAKDDIEHNGDRFYFWKVFFDKGRHLFARKPIMPTPGNHDTPENVETGDAEFSSNAEDTTSYRKYFNLPTDMAFADYYHFDYGNAHFMSVNSEIPVFYGRHPQRDTQQRVAAQRNWLETQLNRSEQSTWNFAYWHVPAINPAGGKDEVSFLRPLTDLFNTKLDWAITGHVHENQRVKPTIATNDSLTQVADYGRHSQQGVGYFICPPAGQWPRNNSTADMDQLAFFPNHNGEVAYEIGYAIFQTNDKTLNIRTFGMGDVDGRNDAEYGDNGSVRLLDQLTYTKTDTPVTFAHQFSSVDYRGTENTWTQTPFTLVADNTWQIEITTAAADSEFKVYADGQWYGDNQPDGTISTGEAANIVISSGAGNYRITFNDSSMTYTVEAI